MALTAKKRFFLLVLINHSHVTIIRVAYTFFENYEAAWGNQRHWSGRYELR